MSMHARREERRGAADARATRAHRGEISAQAQAQALAMARVQALAAAHADAPRRLFLNRNVCQMHSSVALRCSQIYVLEGERVNS